ncbi:MAG: DUF6268 family outer membrane beta-barrel protein [Vicingaceae bacterium]
MLKLKTCLLLLSFIFSSAALFSQNDTTQTGIEEDEEDYSLYDDLEFVDQSAKRFAPVKVSGKSPDQLFSIGYDFQGAYDITAAGNDNVKESTQKVNSTHGIRFGANIPVISKNNIIVQAGLTYFNSQYEYANPETIEHPLHQTLNDNGLNTVDASVTVYKPYNETSFFLVRVAAGANGDYELGDFQPMKYNRYSVALLWGKKPNDNKQWAVGLSRTYRAGELNYLPVVMYNWTSVNRKWGVETLFPARGDLRYNFSPRSMLFAGFDLEGSSFRIGNNGELVGFPNDLELRRSELRFRLRYERQLIGFIWISAKVGYRYNYSFNVDRVPNGEDFFRGFFGDQEYAMENELTNPLFFNFSINLVSP